jgi:hypothetical protein
MGVLLSLQLKEYGTTMFDSLRAGDEVILEEYALGGFSREEAALLLFEDRYGKVSTQHSVIHPALPHTQINPNASASSVISSASSAISNMNMNGTHAMLSPPYQDLHGGKSSGNAFSPTKIEQMISAAAMARGHSRTLSLSAASPTGSGSYSISYSAPPTHSGGGSAMQPSNSHSFGQGQGHGQGGARSVQYHRPAMPVERDVPPQPPVSSTRGHRNWSSSSDIGIVLGNGRR